MRGLRYAIAAFLHLGAAESLSYPLAMLDRLVNLFTVVAVLYLGASLVALEGVSSRVPEGYFVFGMTGLAVMQVFTASLTSFRLKMRALQLHGILEAFALTRTRLWEILLAVPSWELSIALLRALVLVALAHIISGTSVTPLDALASFAVLLLGCSSFLMLGLIAANGVLVLKHGEPITRIVSLATFLFSGAFFPRELLPAALVPVAGLLPVAPTVDAIRSLLHGNEAGFELEAALLRLALTSVLLAPFVVWTYRLAVRRLLRDGSLSHY